MCLAYLTELAEDTYETGLGHVVTVAGLNNRTSVIRIAPRPGSGSSFVVPGDKKGPMLEMSLFI